MARTRKRTNKLDMEHLLVGSNNVALASGTLASTTPAYNISNGQLGVLSADTGSTTAPSGTFLTAGQTITNADTIQVVQGTPMSATTNLANLYEAGHQPAVKTGMLRAGTIRSVTTRRCRLGTYSSEYYSSLPTPADLTEYSIRVDLDSVRNDRDYGDNDEVPFSFYTTPEYSNLPTITNTTSHYLSNLLFGLNVQSRLTVNNQGGNRYGNRNFIAFGIRTTAGGSGQALGTIANGTSIDVMSSNNVDLVYVADHTFVNTVNTWIANGISATATIEQIDLSTAGLATGAGSAFDAVMIMGLDETKSIAFDNIKFVRTRVITTFGDGFLTFPTATKLEAARGVEETGRGSDWTVEFDNRARLAIHNLQNHPHGEYYIEGQTYVDPTKMYTSTIIDYYDYEETLTTIDQIPKQIILLLECEISNPTANATTGLTLATVQTNTVTSLNAIFTPWLTSERVRSSHEILGDATAAAYFV